MIRSPTGTQNFTGAKPFCPHHLQAPHCHWEARQLSRDSWLHFADAETEAWQVAVTQAAGSHQGEVQSRLSESDRTRTPFPFPLCFSTPQLGTSPPLLCPFPCPSALRLEDLIGQLGSCAHLRAN